jgi:hypothetical protein
VKYTNLSWQDFLSMGMILMSVTAALTFFSTGYLISDGILKQEKAKLISNEAVFLFRHNLILDSEKNLLSHELLENQDDATITAIKADITRIEYKRNQIDKRLVELEYNKEELSKKAAISFEMYKPAGFFLIILQLSLLFCSIASLLDNPRIWYGALGLYLIGLIYVVSHYAINYL